MEAIIRNKEGAFADLVRKPEDMQRAALGFIRAIENSFAQDQARSLVVLLKTEREVERRFKICEEWFRVMRGDCGYSVDRSVDFLPHALRCTLDGVAFEPPIGSGGWAPSVLREDKSLS
jgi:hypothetical protein